MLIRRRSCGLWLPPSALALGLALALCGCEKGGSQDTLTVTPGSLEMTRNNETARFSVSGGLRELSLPLTWRVSNSAVGNVIASEGADAEYVRFTPGINIVMVKDQYGAEGFATVNSPGIDGRQPGYNLTLVANPDKTIPAGVTTVTIKVINGLAPYAWSVSDPARGSVSGGTGDTVTYTALSIPAGDPEKNTVICTDRNGARGTIELTKL